MSRFFYFILPTALALLFAGYYFGIYDKEVRAKEAAAEKKEADEKAQAEAQKKTDAEKAAQEAQIRAEQKRKDEEDRRKQREDKQKQEDDNLRKMMEDAETRAANLSKKHADLEIQLASTRRSREAEEAKTFELRREVEQIKIERRNSEMDIQLDVEKIASRVEASSLVQMPIFQKLPGAEKAPAK